MCCPVSFVQIATSRPKRKCILQLPTNPNVDALKSRELGLRILVLGPIPSTTAALPPFYHGMDSMYYRIDIEAYIPLPRSLSPIFSSGLASLERCIPTSVQVGIRQIGHGGQRAKIIRQEVPSLKEFHDSTTVRHKGDTHKLRSMGGQEYIHL